MATKGQQRSTARPGGTSSPPAAVPHDRLVFLLLALVGSKVTVTVKGGARFSGILSAATADGEVNLALRQAQLLSDPSAPLRPSLLIQAKDLQEVQAEEVSLDARTSERDSFKTDEQVTGLAGDRREKQLQAWGSGSAGGGIEDDGIGGLSLDDEPLGAGQRGGAAKWDQFATNERLYGTRTDYHEELYTTKLDRTGADFRAREQRAAQLEREILKGGGLSNNAHVAEERGEVLDDSGLNEEDRYSTVIRGPDAYVAPGARGKTPLARSAANGSTNGVSAPSTPAPAMSLAASAKAQDPSIISVSTGGSNSRLPVSTSSTSRIPAQVPADTNAAVGGNSKTAVPTVEGSFRDFVTSERQRLTEKKAALAKEAQRQDKDSKLASLLEFSQNFKLKSPMPADIAEIAGRGKAKVVPQAAASTSSSTLTPGAGAIGSASTATSPVVSPARLGVSRALTPATGGPPQATAPRFASGGKSSLIAEIPPFNPNRAKKAAEETAAATSASAAGDKPGAASAAGGASAPTPTLLKPPGTGSKINPNAPAFVFRPNPNASSFTPGFTPSSSLSASVPASKSPCGPSPQPVNPFFGTKQIKKGSASMHVKEDFTPFKNASVGEPATIVPTWTFTGKPYRSMYPPSPTPPPMMGLGDDDQQPPQMALHHPPPPMPQGYGVYQPQFAPQQQQHQQQQQPGFNPRFVPQQPPMHMPPQFQQFAPPPQNMNFGQPPGPPMFGSPQMQPSQQGAYMRYTPFPPGPGGPQQPPPQQQQQQQPAQAQAQPM